MVPKVILEATHQKTLDSVGLEVLSRFASDGGDGSANRGGEGNGNVTGSVPQIPDKFKIGR